MINTVNLKLRLRFILVKSGFFFLAFRDLIKVMDRSGGVVPPLMFLQVCLSMYYKFLCSMRIFFCIFNNFLRKDITNLLVHIIDVIIDQFTSRSYLLGLEIIFFICLLTQPFCMSLSTGLSRFLLLNVIELHQPMLESIININS